ncbi:MAG: phosphotransferase [Ardenticatenia bacterium]|nr:phosphotransferase [Ardenticatenia bacterium]
MRLKTRRIREYLSRIEGQTVSVEAVHPLGVDPTADGEELKAFGYGKPLLVRYRVNGGSTVKQVVLNTMLPNHFGHEYRADRAASLLLAYDTYNHLPAHARALDVGVVEADGHLTSLGHGDEFFLLTEFVDGTPYADDLVRLRETGHLTDVDVRRAQALAEYLAHIHAVKRHDPDLYHRRLRDLVGGGEGIMGLIDSYPSDFPLAPPQWLAWVESRCVEWRWRLREKEHRLAQVHGDYHPYNVLFTRGTEFRLLDRSRGPWGEPADDVAALVINYLFFSLQRCGRLAFPFDHLWDTFWTTYLARTGDEELLSVIAPFLAWRGLVVASPLWYHVEDDVRRAIFAFITNVLTATTFDPAQVHRYLMSEETYEPA